KLWNISSANFTYTYLQSPAKDNTTRPSSIFILRGSVVSYMNASHPLVQTRLTFELQIFEVTEVMILHIIELSHASQQDLWHPLSIGSLWSTTFQSEGSMALNNEFLSPDATPYSATIQFAPFLDE